MGLIGKDLIQIIKCSEASEDWDLTLQLLSLAQRLANEEYERRIDKILDGKDWRKK